MVIFNGHSIVLNRGIVELNHSTTIFYNYSIELNPGFVRLNDTISILNNDPIELSHGIVELNDRLIPQIGNLGFWIAPLIVQIPDFDS